MNKASLLTVVLLLMLALAGCDAPDGARRVSVPVVEAAAANADARQSTRAVAPDDAAERAPLKLPLVRPKIVVSKSGRRLMLYADGRLLRTYRAGLGLSPVEDKVRQGDRRTPEGEFYIFTKNNRSAFYLSLGLSYPNVEDAERGLRDGLITRAQYRSILRAQERRIAPPQNTALGGDIYIHGNGASSDWTWGCVALEDSDIKELFDAVPVGTTVVIEH
ncbi:MAG TPA: L,D-transpeptidase [Pyrinomonadaceae bacterium]|nr:L,D-transpeptidase [Pyrinomonadaceae bacterium]